MGLKKLGGVWKNKGKGFSGQFTAAMLEQLLEAANDNGGKVRIQVFENEKRSPPYNDPDFTLHYSDDGPQDRAAKPKDDGDDRGCMPF